MVARLPKSQFSTVRACWEGAGGGSADKLIAGVRYAAWSYVHTKHSDPLASDAAAPFAGIKAYQIERELVRVASDARALLSKLADLSPFSLELIHLQLGENAGFPLMAEEMGFAHGEDVGSWEPGGIMVQKLEDLAGNVETVAKMVAGRKQPPNGRREKVSGRLLPVEQLIFDIGQIVSFRKGKVTHILPIARVVHEWATGEIPGPTWGGRPYENVRPSLEALNWDEFSDEQRTPKLDQKWNPTAGMRRLEWLMESIWVDLKAPYKTILK